MGDITDDANEAFRDFEIDGIPSSGPHDPIKGEIRGLFGTVDSAISTLAGALVGTVAHDTLAHLNADTSHPDNTLGIVYADGANNGYYYILSGVWHFTGVAITTQVHLANLGTDVTALMFAVAGLAPMFQLLDPSSGYVFAITDASSHAAFLVATDGSVTIPKLIVPNGAVGFAQLATALSQLLPTVLSPESGYLYAITDAAGKLAFAIDTAGAIVLGNLSPASIPANSVAERQLVPLLDRLVMPHITDVVEVQGDSWRAGFGQVAVDTSITGTLWATFPPVLTRCLRGLNVSGTSLQFRPASGLGIRGKRRAGTWSPIAVNNVVSNASLGDCFGFSGNVSLATGSQVNLPASASIGQYYRYASQVTAVLSGVTLVLGDLVVWNGSAWVGQVAAIQGAGGAPFGGRLEGDWWDVTAAGTFDGQTYAIGDRLVYIGYDSFSGIGHALWYKASAVGKGELFYQGTFVPATGSPLASPGKQGDLWQASTGGTEPNTGITFATGDYAIWDGGTWGKVASGPITTVASGAMIPGLTCIQSASEWEVRRTDLSATVAGVMATCRHQSSPRRNVDNIVCRSDSMFDVPNIPAQLAPLVTPRPVTKIARGGGSSRNVLSTKEYEVAVQGDAFHACFEFIWHGQNNQPSTVGDASWAQIVEVSHKLADLIGARDRRFCFLSVLGQNAMTFSGGRIVVAQHEAMFAGTGPLYALEQFYAAMWPGQYLSPRLALLAAAATLGSAALLDARVPGTGMTEADTAATYGWIPLSWWTQLTPIPIPLSSLVLKGYFNTNGLPTGGSPNDCWTRSGGTTSGGLGGVGNLLINVAGTWGEYVFDATHLGSAVGAGGTYMAQAMAAYLAANLT